jgi:hypothetical protein
VISFLKIFIDYIAVPGTAWAMSLLGGLDWIGRTSEVNRSLSGGVVMLLMVSAYAYQTGYRGFYRAGRKGYFYVVFIAPIVVGAMGLLAGLMLGAR